MSRTHRIRNVVYDFLKERVRADFHEVKSHVNSSIRHGTTSTQLSNILAKDVRFELVGMADHYGIVGHRYQVSVWTLAGDQ